MIEIFVRSFSLVFKPDLHNDVADHQLWTVEMYPLRVSYCDVHVVLKRLNACITAGVTKRLIVEPDTLRSIPLLTHIYMNSRHKSATRWQTPTDKNGHKPLNAALTIVI